MMEFDIDPGDMVFYEKPLSKEEKLENINWCLDHIDENSEYGQSRKEELISQLKKLLP